MKVLVAVDKKPETFIGLRYVAICWRIVMLGSKLFT